MVDIATLGVQVDTTTARSGASNLDRFANSAKKAETSAKRMATGTKASAAAMRTYDTAVVKSARHTANLTAQFNDMAVMTLGGQAPLLLAAQQGTQVTQVFQQMNVRGVGALKAIGSGLAAMVSPTNLVTLGLIAGGAALTQWALSAGSAKDETDDLTKQLEELAEFSAKLSRELRTLRLGVSSEELTIIDQIITLREQENEIQQKLAEADNRQARGYRAQLSALQDQREELEGQLDDLRAAVDERERLSDITQQTVDQERALGDQMQRTAQEIRSAENVAKLLRDGLSASAIDALRLAGVDLSSPISSASASAAQLAANLGIALDAAISLQNQRASRDYGSGRGGDPRDFGDQFNRVDNGARPLGNDAQSMIDAALRRNRRSSGGGGISDAQREMEEMERRRAEILRSLETEQDRYNRAVQEANDLLEAGLLTQEQYNEHIDRLGSELEAVEFEGLTSGIEDIGDAMAGAIVDGENFGDAIASVFRNLASEILSSGVREAIGSVFNASSGGGGGFFGLLGNLLSFDGGGYTGPGSRTGGVDGRGGFPAILHPNETVIDHTKARPTAGMGATTTINQNFRISANGDDSVRRIVREEAPRMAEVAVAAVGERNRRDPAYLGPR